MNCIICGQPAEVHHIVTRKAYGNDRNGYDQPVNHAWLCRIHHTEVHYTGAVTFWEKYGYLEKYEVAHNAYREYEKAKNGRE